jgi:hypothetical protein
MKVSGSKQKARPVQGPSVKALARYYASAVGYDPQVEQTMQLNDDSGSIGTEQGVSPPLTPTESEKLEEQAVLHELQGCGGTLNFLPAWVFDELTVPASFMCYTCNHLLLLGREETYFAR